MSHGDSHCEETLGYHVSTICRSGTRPLDDMKRGFFGSSAPGHGIAVTLKMSSQRNSSSDVVESDGQSESRLRAIEAQEPIDVWLCRVRLVSHSASATASPLNPASGSEARAGDVPLAASPDWLWTAKCAAPCLARLSVCPPWKPGDHCAPLCPSLFALSLSLLAFSPPSSPLSLFQHHTPSYSSPSLSPEPTHATLLRLSDLTIFFFYHSTTA